MDKCIHCGGTGEVVCKICDGKGKLPCPECGGSGRKMLICQTCTEGRVPDPRAFDDEPTLICPDCHGEYKKELGPCEMCNGSGTIPCETCGRRGKEECSACGGDGEIDIIALCWKLLNKTEDSYIKLNEDNITEDIVRVVQHAADNGAGLAAAVMGELYWWGLKINDKNIVGKDKAKAMEYWRLGAEAGDPIAQGQYGIALCIGLCGDEKPDVVAGFPWLVKAGENGNIESLYLLAIDGYIYEEYGNKRDLHKSLECFNAILSAKDRDDWYQGYVDAAKEYVRFLPRIIDGDTKAMLALSECMKKIEEDALRGYSSDGIFMEDDAYWIEQAAKTVDVSAMLKMGSWFFDESKTRDEEDKELYNRKAIEWYEKAADKGNVVALSTLGSRLRTGDGIAQDFVRAFRLLYAAAEKGSIAALRQLAHMYRDGAYVVRDRKLANVLYTKAAKSGDGWSLYEIGKCYKDGKTVPQDLGEAKRLLTLAVEKGCDKAKSPLSAIPESVKIGNKKPSGIGDKPDTGPLPKFVIDDYKCAVKGKPAKTKAQKSASGAKKRSKFVVLGLFLGFVGAHLAYAKRWGLFLLLWACLVTTIVLADSDSDSRKHERLDAQVQVVSDPNARQTDKSPSVALTGVGCTLTWLALWLGGAIFIKKDGNGNRM